MTVVSLRFLILLFVLCPSLSASPLRLPKHNNCQAQLKEAYGPGAFQWRLYRGEKVRWISYFSRTLETPFPEGIESQLAAADALVLQGQPQAVLFAHLLEQIHASGVFVRVQASSGEKVRAKLKKTSLWVRSLGRARYSKQLLIKFPKKAPQNQEEFWDRLLSLSYLLQAVLIEQQKKNVAWASLPLGPESFGYAEHSLNVMEASFAQFYSLLKAGEAFGLSPTERLPKRDRHWRWGLHRLEFAIDIPMRLQIPFFYDPFFRLRPNLEDYQRFQDGQLRARLRSLVKGRARIRWFSVTSRRLAIPLGVLALIQVPSLFQSFDGWITWGPMGFELDQSQFEQMREQHRFAERLLPTDEEVDQARSELWEEFTRPIERLEQEIQATGDPTGALQQQLQEAIELREWMTQ